MHCAGAAMLIPVLASAGLGADPGPERPAVRWHRDLGRGAVAPPVVEGALCIFGLVDGKLMAVDVQREKIEWKRKPARSFVSRPVLWGDAVYGVGADVRDGVFGVDRRSGRVRWRKRVGEVVGGPCVTEAGVIVGTRDGRILCLSRDRGDLSWEARTGCVLLLSTPVPIGAAVLVPTLGDTLHLLDTERGDRLWSAVLPGGVAGTAAVSGDTIFAATASGLVTALEGQSGSVLWRTDTRDGFASGPVLGDGGVFAASLRGVVRRFRFSDGEPMWSTDLGSVLRSPPALVAGVLIVGTLVDRVFGLDPASGRVLWEVPVHGGVEAAVVGAGGKAVVVTDRGDLYVLE